MKIAFQISRPLRFLSTLLLVALSLLLWGEVYDRDLYDLSNTNSEPSQDSTRLSSPTFLDNAFAILPDTSKVMTHDFHWIGNFLQVKLFIVSDPIDVARTQLVNFSVRNIGHILVSIHAP